MATILLVYLAVHSLIALVFLVFSAAELVDTGRSTPARLAATLIACAVWPVTLVVMSVTVLLARASARRASAGAHLAPRAGNVIAFRRPS